MSVEIKMTLKTDSWMVVLLLNEFVPGDTALRKMTIVPSAGKVQHRKNDMSTPNFMIRT